jgi:hypothetical protein
MADFGRTLNAATPGLGRLALAIGGGGGPAGAYQKAYDGELSLQSKLAQAMATIEANGATARLHNLQADETQGQLDARKPESVLSAALTTNGIPTEEAGAVQEYLKTGQLGGKYRPLPAELPGPVVPAPDWVDKLGTVARSVGTTQGALAVGDKSISSVAKAEGERRDQQLSNDVINGKLDPTKVAQGQYAASGKAPYNFAEYGVGNNLTGRVDDTTGPAVRFGQYRKAETGNQNAGAEAHRAAADSSRASAAKSRAETDQVVNGPKGVLVQTDNGPVFADPRSGRSVPVTNPDGTPAAPKLKDIPAAQNHAFIENAKSIQNIEAAMDAIYKATGIRLDENGNPTRDPNAKPTAPNALGARNYMGDGIRQRTDPGGVTVRAQVANISGQKYHDISGAAVSVGESKRLAPFIPLDTDSPVTVLQKLANLRREYGNVNDMMAQTYSREQGFKPSVAARSGGQAPGKGGTVDFHALPSGGGGGPREINFSDLKK